MHEKHTNKETARRRTTTQKERKKRKKERKKKENKHTIFKRFSVCDLSTALSGARLFFYSKFSIQHREQTLRS